MLEPYVIINNMSFNVATLGFLFFMYNETMVTGIDTFGCIHAFLMPTVFSRYSTRPFSPLDVGFSVSNISFSSAATRGIKDMVPVGIVKPQISSIIRILDWRVVFGETCWFRSTVIVDRGLLIPAGSPAVPAARDARGGPAMR